MITLTVWLSVESFDQLMKGEVVRGGVHASHSRTVTVQVPLHQIDFDADTRTVTIYTGVKP